MLHKILKRSDKSKDDREPLLSSSNGHSKPKQKPSKQQKHATPSLTLSDDFDEDELFSAYQPPKISQGSVQDDEKAPPVEIPEVQNSNLTSSSNYAAFFAVAPNQPSAEIKHEIPDELVYRYIRDESLKVIDRLLKDRLDDTTCWVFFNKCMEPNEIERAQELKTLLTVYDEIYEITDVVIDFIRTGEVKRDYGNKVKSYGESSLDSQSLRGMFINRFIPYYTKFRGEDWLRAAVIRQGNWINDGYHNFDEVVLFDLVKKEIDVQLTRLEARKMELEKKLPEFTYSSQQFAMKEELRRLEQQLHELMPKQYVKPTISLL